MSVLQAKWNFKMSIEIFKNTIFQNIFCRKLWNEKFSIPDFYVELQYNSKFGPASSGKVRLMVSGIPGKLSWLWTDDIVMKVLNS